MILAQVPWFGGAAVALEMALITVSYRAHVGP
jgi:hypothetical protein